MSDKLEYHIYGPGNKHQILAEVNKDYTRGIIRTMMSCAMAYDSSGEPKFCIMAKRNPQMASNNFTLHDSRDE